VAVEGVERSLAAGVSGRVQGERDGLGASEEAGLIGVSDDRPLAHSVLSGPSPI
jgi:hypothetical protein